MAANVRQGIKSERINQQHCLLVFLCNGTEQLTKKKNGHTTLDKIEKIKVAPVF
jgi:hypothetical protein